MNTIDRQEIKKRLIQEGYIESNGLDKTIENLLNLSGKAQEMLYEWINKNKKAEFEAIEDIDSNILREELKMKEPAIILSYGMLIDNPKVNSIQLKKLLKGRLVFSPKI